MAFKKTKNWLARWTWKKLWKLIAPIFVQLLKEQMEELKDIAAKDGEAAIKEIKEKVDSKMK